MQRNLYLERIYPHSPEKVWKALTDPAAMAQWLMPNDFQPYVGHRFTFKTASAPGFDGVVRCEVITVDKPRTLSYSWHGGPMKHPTIVTWTLEATPEGTRLKLAHTGFEGFAGIALSFILGAGWRNITGKLLPEYLNTPSESTILKEEKAS